MHIFFKPEVQSDEQFLNEEESKHCVRVLRLKQDDIVYLVDGVGGFYYARISDPNPKKCRLFVYQSFKEYGKKNYHLSIAIAPTKNIDRFEWFLEKAAEIGIDRIIPIVCKQSEREIIKPERLIKILIEAIKQSKQAYLPELSDITRFKSLVNSNFMGKKLIAHCNENEKNLLKNAIVPGEHVLVLIGPEGDFTREEVEIALQNGFQEVSLGSNRLRTETAGIVACHTVALINQ